MGGCNCGKNAKPTGFGVNPRQEQSELNALVRANEPNGAQQQAAAAQSTQQSFSVRDRGGKVQSFGSRLERNAFITREGGTILP